MQPNGEASAKGYQHAGDDALEHAGFKTSYLHNYAKGLQASIYDFAELTEDVSGF